MLPLSQRIHGRRLAVLALGAAVVIGGAYGYGSRQAQVTGPNICIRSYGPFFQTESRDPRRSDAAAFPNSNFFVKVTGDATVSLFSYGADGSIEKVRDIPGEYRGAAVTVLDDSWIEIAYYEPFESGFKAFVRAVRVFGGSDLGTPYPLGEFAASFESNVRFAIDTMEPGRFVVVTNIPDGLGQRNLRAMVAGRTGGQTTLTLLGPSAVPPADTPAAVMDFDVAAIDYQQINDMQFVVAFRGPDGLQLQRGNEGPGGVIVDPAYLKTISATGRDVDLASSSVRQKRAAMAYMDKGQAYAGEIILGDPSPGPIMPEEFTPVALGKSGDVLATPGVAWLTDRYYVAGIGVKSSTDASRKGVYIRRGTVGSTAFGSELRVTSASGLQSMALLGLPGVRGRVLASQQSTVEPENGMTASFCAGCISGVADTGEQCQLPITTGTSGSEAICDPRFCGNDEINPGEQCDDGNTAFDDGCDALCRLECSSDGDCPSGECAGGICTNLCGNGTVEPPVCVSESGPMTCPPPVEGDVRIVNLPGGIFPLTHTSADVDGDGRMDVVVANYTGNTAPQPDGHGLYSGTIEVFLNQGNGAFAARRQIGTFQWNDGGGDRGMDAFDADGDGDADVVVADSSENGFVLLRNDGMTFKRVPFASGFLAFHLFHGDADEDGDPDLGIDGFGTYEADYHSVLLGGQGATFRNASNIFAQDGSYDTSAFADMDGDGDDDYVNLAGFSTGVGIAFYRSNGDGTFADATQLAALNTSTVTTSIRVADVNRDGDMDVLIGENGFRVLVVLGDGAGGSTSVTPVSLPFAPRLLAVADPSADGVPDIVFGPGQGTEGRNLWYAKGNGDGTFAAPVRFVTLNPPASGRPPLSYNNSYYYNYDLHAADYDGDGRLDLSLTHALSSDSASVILFRSSIASCTQVPPVVTCSQAEECDDGSQNGQPGKCTIRCTYCGNGEIDVVNGVPEACDEGSNNGEPGSGCSLTCAETFEERLGCVNRNACALVPKNSDAPFCNTGEDCPCDPADPSCNPTHLGCVDNACVQTTNPFAPSCDTNADCTPCPASNPNCHQQCNVLALQCVAEPLGSCDAGECANKHLECVNQACTVVDGAGDNLCDTAADCVTVCGNGVVDPGESCDEGPRNRTTAPENLAEWYCKALSCTRSECFDGIDNDGDGLGDISDAGCWSYDVPKRPVRGVSLLGFLLGQVTPPLENLAPKEYLAGKEGESCPADTVDRGSFCALTCEAGDICPGGEACPQDGVCPVICGNGAIDDGEQCDDGNLIDGDLCSNSCKLNECTGLDCPRCGDGVYQHVIGEQCDDGNSVDTDECTNNCRTHCDGDADCPGKCDMATNQCLPPLCGDGEVNQPWERCDDGDIDDEDSCNNQCQPTCKADADCESGKCNEKLLICMPICGNGAVNPGEQCDDGNANDADACTNACQMTCSDDSTCDCDEDRGVCRSPCGNGRLDEGESCDDGNTDDRDQCTNLCRVRCRPGTLCPDQQACPQNGVCPVIGVCGDGEVNSPFEQCDDGNKNDADGCTNACTIRCDQNLECPNGLLCTAGECSECSNSLQCDGGFCVAGRCRAALPICGNGVMEPGEACDDANSDDADGCTTACRFGQGQACAASAQCQTNLCQAGVCAPCSSAGECSSGMRCAEGNCLFGSLQCGDGVVQAGEACDDANFSEQDGCTTLCLLPFGGSCSHASQCASTICSAGSCTPCRADAECSSGLRCAIGLCLSDAQMAMLPNICGNGFPDDGEQCDDGNAAYGDGCTPSCAIGNGPSRSEVAANVAVQMPFVPMRNVGGEDGGGDGYGYGLHSGAGGNLSDSGPATVAVMAAGAAAGAAWVRRRLGRIKR